MKVRMLIGALVLAVLSGTYAFAETSGDAAKTRFWPQQSEEETSENIGEGEEISEEQPIADEDLSNEDANTEEEDIPQEDPANENEEITEETPSPEEGEENVQEEETTPETESDPVSREDISEEEVTEPQPEEIIEEPAASLITYHEAMTTLEPTLEDINKLSKNVWESYRELQEKGNEEKSEILLESWNKCKEEIMENMNLLPEGLLFNSNDKEGNEALFDSTEIQTIIDSINMIMNEFESELSAGDIS